MLHVPETGSTNADLRQLAEAGGEEGLWLRADRQTAGRGRQGRDWSSPSGNFYGSTLVRLRPGDPMPATLALVAAVAIEDAVRSCLSAIGARLALKWPNDLLIDGAKLSGILLERVGDAVVIGMGINLASAPDLPDRATTALCDHGVAVSPAAMQALLADAMTRWVAIWREQGLPAIIARWEARAHPRGAMLTARLPDGQALTGIFQGLASDGALRLGLADGSAHVIHAGDIFLV
ncbi:biotin--[acetyl-CoA-carboxylase] ligase [uncultured Sphingomonas sp.]|uniref:biotin--[acetyl-CoA-carboxylase] ligase n=1 Tax=uncultured Sphingomonas sp. TaxID=158754 RepID=UPI0025DCA7AA|nr:biotin--[acetyl-CoA-carboxylase] ligase [uncultured Sphingomonas sp.]